MEDPPLPRLSPYCRLSKLFNEEDRIKFANACARVQLAHEQGQLPSSQDQVLYHDGRDLIGFAASLPNEELSEMVHNWRRGLREAVEKHIQSGQSLGSFPLSGCYLMAVFAPTQEWTAKIAAKDVFASIQGIKP